MTSISPIADLVIYPDYCHSLSPTIGKWCPLRAMDVHALKDVGVFSDGRVLYHHLNHPIKWVRLTGVIVAVDDFYGKKVYTLDDSSGSCIECTCVAPAPLPTPLAIPLHLNRMGQDIKPTTTVPTTKTISKLEKEKEEGKGEISVQKPKVPWEELDVGVVVKVKGKIGERWGVKQVEVVKIEVVGCTEVEVRCWNEVERFRREVLGRVWVVGREEEEDCRREREKSIRRARRRAEYEKEREEKRRVEREKGRAERAESERRRKEEKMKTEETEYRSGIYRVERGDREGSGRSRGENKKAILDDRPFQDNSRRARERQEPKRKREDQVETAGHRQRRDTTARPHHRSLTDRRAAEKYG